MGDTSGILPYVEFQLTDHCNLNCKGCTHFCPISDINYLSMDSFVKDMQRLSDIFTNILQIRIMGGEPLLHPLVSTFAEKTRQIFPSSAISIVTNGILLPSMNHTFYETLQKNIITLDISVYPITKETMSSYIQLALQYEIPIKFVCAGYFCKFVNTSGNSDKNLIFKQCGMHNCTFLRDGKIYHCCLPALSNIINKKFWLSIPGNDYIDIHTDISAVHILDFLDRPSATCAFCKEATWFPWELSKSQKDEWIVS